VVVFGTLFFAVLALMYKCARTIVWLYVNTSKTDPLAPAQCDPLTILFQNGVN